MIEECIERDFPIAFRIGLDCAEIVVPRKFFALIEWKSVLAV